MTADRDAQLARLDADGYVVLDGLLSARDLRTYRDALAPHFARQAFGRNDFEGRRTERVYTLPAVHAAFAALAAHPHVLALLDALLAPHYLLTAGQAIRIHPGETAQALHFDDSFYPFPRPRAPISVATICAIDDFTAENGATEVIRGSHRWGDVVPRGVVSAGDFAQATTYGRGADSALALSAEHAPDVVDAAPQPVVMPAGSVVLFLGTLWHRGGANRSAAPRLAVTYQYCEPWARQQENFTLAIAPEVARAMPERVQELLGYTIHPPFMGHVGGVHPKRRLA
ncbi:MAG: phytanoyl-CoA dioxygenase family protein [bacterium]|nr:phytanoyl-CoA dioxygenase family protein [bacterium]